MIWLIILLGYVLPAIIICLGFYYCDMESGQTIKEFFDENGYHLILGIVCPGVNLYAALAFIFYVICKKIGNIRKP